MQPCELTFMARIEQMFSKVTAENPLLQYPRLLEPSSGRARQNERAEESDQLPVLPQHGFARLIGRGPLDEMCWKLQVMGHLVSYDCHALAREETDLEASLASPPHRFFWRRHVNHRYHISHLQT
jgi:hypothetical protein